MGKVVIMPKLEVRAYVLEDFEFYNWDLEIDPLWEYEDWVKHKEYYNRWISFDCLAYDSARKSLYCGLARFNSDILYVFDLENKEFRSLGYKRVADPYDAKFHKSLELDSDGTLYGAIAGYHDINKQFEAPGGAIVKYDPNSGKVKRLCIPIPHAYIQSIVMDRTRKLIYGFTLYPERFFSYNLRTGEVKDIALIGSGFEMCQPHKGAIDLDGNVWGTWGRTRAWHDVPGARSIRLFKYSPDEGRIYWLDKGVYNKATGYCEAIDGAVTGSDGYIYIGTKNGNLVRLDPQTADVEFIATPCGGGRLAALAFGPDGMLYGIGGQLNEATLFAFDTRRGRLWKLGRIFDSKLDAAAGKIHDMVITEDLVIYAGENDNWTRASYLWECEVQW